MPLFLIFIMLTIIHTIQSYTFSSLTIRRGLSSCLLVSSSLLRSAKEEPPSGAEPRMELGPALQQADELPTELRRNLIL